MVSLTLFNSIFTDLYSDDSPDITTPPGEDEITTYPKHSAGYFEAFIHIDGSILNNWSDTETNELWCDGQGTFEDPYTIENVTVVSGWGRVPILIENSMEYFEIKNCTVRYSSGGAQEAGIVFMSVGNGTIRNCTIRDNAGDGIYFRTSSNNTIDDCKIDLWTANLHNITSNDVKNNTNGIEMSTSNQNTIKNNNFTQNSLNGIRLFGTADNNNLINNRLEKNLEKGIYLENTFCDDNVIWGNYLIDNQHNAVDEGTGTIWNTVDTGNYWSNYTDMGAGAVDADDDGFGDIAFNVWGSGGNSDNKPIWDDGHDGTKIHIDDTGVSGETWEWVSDQSWCSGIGTQGNPYIIEDLIIDGGNSDSCLIVENSDAFFTLDNITCSNSGTNSKDAGIKLIQTNNGTLTGCNSSLKLLNNSKLISYQKDFLILANFINRKNNILSNIL
ncbi:MAG: right-handed parallel beta-helix repeat-containing protein [Promethearchaeota archaeon]